VIYFYEIDNGAEYPEEYAYKNVYSYEKYTEEEFKGFCKEIVDSCISEDPYEFLREVVDGLCKKHGFKRIINTSSFSINPWWEE
jgi:hypothetical protein